MLVIMLIVSCVSGFLFLRQQRQQEDQLAKTIGAILSESISRISFSGKYHSRLLLEELQKKLPELSYISVENQDGLIIASTDPQQNDTTVDGKSIIENRKTISEKAVSLAEKHIDGVAVKEVLLPFTSGLESAPGGTIRIGIKVDETRNRQRLTLFIHIFLVIVLTIVAVWIMEALNRHFTSRLMERDQALLEKSEELNRFFTLSLDLLCIANTSGQFLRLNLAWEKALGYPLEELMQYNFLDLIHPDDLEATHKALASLRQQHEILSFENRYRCKDGSFRWIEWRSRPQGELIYAAARDTTERKRAEAERQNLMEQLAQAQKIESVGRLAGGVAHDFNNMLGVILGHCELAMAKIGKEHPVYASIGEIRKAADRSAGLTRQLLAFARKQTVSPKALDLNETVEGMLTMLHRLIGEDIDLVWKPGKKLGMVKMDPGQIDQVLANLCVNARDAIGDTGKIIIETAGVALDDTFCTLHPEITPGEYVLLTIQDSGCGMDQTVLANIFEPFFTTKGVGKGTGLGLATVYGIIRQNNGSIQVYSEPGHGTIFMIYLPKHRRDKLSNDDEYTEPPVSGGHETILLVEDEPMILEMTTQILDNLGYTVISVPGPNEAIMFCSRTEERIGLLITDVIMPEMNGRDLARALSSHFPGMKCLFMSGYTADVIAHHGVLDDGVEFIQKPFTTAEFAARVRRVLDKSL